MKTPLTSFDFGRRAPQVLRLTVAATLFAISLSAQSNNDAQQALMQAIQHNDAASVSRLIASGADPNVKDADGAPALMLATLFADAACVEQLLKQGADPNQADAAGATALMWAMPDIQKARVLIAHGANVNARSTNLGAHRCSSRRHIQGRSNCSICCSREAPICAPEIRRGIAPSRWRCGLPMWACCVS